MVSLFGIFNLGSQSLGAQQRGLAITADNIANVNTEGYSRQRVRLVTGDPVPTPQGLFGGGVRLDGIDRIRNEALDTQIRFQLTAEGFYRQSRLGYEGLQAALIDTLAASPDETGMNTEIGLNQALLRLFDAFGEVSLEPENVSTRVVAIEEARNVAEAFQSVSVGLRDQIASLNNQVPGMVDRVNSLTERIAALNARIADYEVGGLRTASTLRDERGVLLNELSELARVQIVETESGAVNVSLAGSLLVSHDRANSLEAVRREGDPFLAYDVMTTGNPPRRLTEAIDGGELGAVLRLRDEVIPSYLEEIDTLARSVIWEVNRIHSRGVGLTGFSAVSSENAASNADAVLNAAGYPFTMEAGTFSIRVLDESGEEIGTYSIDIDPSSDSLNDIAARIDAADGTVGGGDLLATVNADGTLTVSTSGNQQLTFAGDSSGFLATLGINTLFSGWDAASMGLSDAVAANPLLLAASETGAAGDNGAALELAGLRDSRVMNDGRASLTDFYQSVISRLGTESGRAESLETSSGLMVDSLKMRQEELSGVSVDEEAINLMRYQRAFEAAARLITTVDEMLATIIERTGLAGR
jgi:flagellar hook-associated protein 1 FlgK